MQLNTDVDLKPSQTTDGEGAPSALPSDVDRVVLEISRISKAYGHTVAAKEVSIEIRARQMVAIVGHNGAGKSTVAKIIGGMVTQDEGTVVVDGEKLPVPSSVSAARQSGVALAHQEITLFPDLRVFEHVGAGELNRVRKGWRKQAIRAIKGQLDAMFPSHGISPHALVASLSLAQRQMLQNALATMSQNELKLLILDEPTSSLSDDLAEELFAYLTRLREERGLSVILVSHKVADILDHCDRTIVMRDGEVVSDRATGELTVRQLMVDMGAAPTEVGQHSSTDVPRVKTEAKPVLEIRDLEWQGLRNVSMIVGVGEIVGLAGLEANGQRQVLEAAWRARRSLQPRRVRRSTTLRGTVSYVSGDRQEEGIFPLWSVARNVSIASLGEISRFGLISSRKERQQTADWIERMAIKADREDPILSLSGGNQQKVLLARGLARSPELLILDDPFRGVDISTKAEAYRRLRELAASGASILWYTSENRELLECDRVYVMRRGECTAELSADRLNAEQIVLTSFGESVDYGVNQ